MVTGNRLLLSTGVISMTAVIIKLSLPIISSFLTSDLPYIWSLAFYYLRPPYLYLLINCIILSIVASNKLHPRGGTDNNNHDYLFPSPTPEKFLDEEKEEGGGGDDVEVVFGCVDESDKTPVKVLPEREVGGGGDEYVISRSTWTPPKMTVEEEKPLVSSRFSHRRGVKASPEGKSPLLKVSRPKKQETLESTWRRMTEGRPIPLTRHLKKSDTFTGTSQHAPSKRVMKKSETFTVASNSSPGSGTGGKMRREPSLSQDELNRRVEAFIKKFNEEMRLQRQESLNQYNEMVNRGFH